MTTITVPQGITVHTDENGVTREYLEQKRPAMVGELVKRTGGANVWDRIFIVDSVSDIYPNGVKQYGYGGVLFESNYVVLVPTGIIHYADKRWKTVERKASGGDTILIRNATCTFGDYGNGSFFTVEKEYGDGGVKVFTKRDNDCDYICHSEYVVLEPIVPARNSHFSQWLLTLTGSDRIIQLETELAAVKQRVSTLESQGTTSGNNSESTVTTDKPVEFMPVTGNPSTWFQKQQPQYTREDVIEMAKEDVEELFIDGKFGVGNAVDLKHAGHCTVQFIVNRDKRTVTALLRLAYIDTERVHAVGTAHCAPDDCFNVHIGKAVALRRALGLDVPTYYTKAPHPTVAQVGDIVRITGNDYSNAGGRHCFKLGSTVNITKDRSGLYISNPGEALYCYDGVYHQTVSKRNFRIIDDTHDFGGEDTISGEAQ